MNATKSKPKNKKPAASARPLRLEYVEAGSLTPNPRNWRTHPQSQLDALSNVLHDPEIGWADAVIFNERTGHVVDGHARLKSTGPKEIVPVLVGSWTAKAEQKILLTKDPIAALAGASADALASLRADVGTALDSDAFASLRANLDQLAKPVDVEKKNSAAGGGSLTDQYKIVVTCKDEMHQADLLDAIDQSDGPRIADLLKGQPCKALVG